MPIRLNGRMIGWCCLGMATSEANSKAATWEHPHTSRVSRLHIGETLMKVALKFAGLILLINLAGCGMGWVRPNTSEAEFYQDRYQCEKEAATMYPVAMRPSDPGYQAPAQTNCTSYGNQISCTTTPGPYFSAPQHDANANARSSAIGTCLQARGYVWRWSRE